MQNIEDLCNDVKVCLTDLRDERNCLRVTKHQDYVIQLAANMGGIGYITKIGADIMRDNFLININMLHSVYRNKVKRYFYSSSACIYPECLQRNTEVIPLKESDAYPADPDQFYGWEKLGTEKMCEAYQRDYQMDIRIARFHNIYGEAYTAFDKQKGKAPCHMIMKAIKYPDEPYVVWGDGNQTRSFLYISDCVEAILELLDSGFDKPINIGTDYLVSMNDLAQIAIKKSGKQITIEHDLMKPTGVRGRNADLTLIKAVLGWSPKVSLETGMDKVYDWAVENLDKLENI